MGWFVCEIRSGTRREYFYTNRSRIIQGAALAFPLLVLLAATVLDTNSWLALAVLALGGLVGGIVAANVVLLEYRVQIDRLSGSIAWSRRRLFVAVQKEQLSLAEVTHVGLRARENLWLICLFTQDGVIDFGGGSDREASLRGARDLSLILEIPLQDGQALRSPEDVRIGHAGRVKRDGVRVEANGLPPATSLQFEGNPTRAVVIPPAGVTLRHVATALAFGVLMALATAAIYMIKGKGSTEERIAVSLWLAPAAGAICLLWALWSLGSRRGRTTRIAWEGDTLQIRSTAPLYAQTIRVQLNAIDDFEIADADGDPIRLLCNEPRLVLRAGKQKHLFGFGLSEPEKRWVHGFVNLLIAGEVGAEVIEAAKQPSPLAAVTSAAPAGAAPAGVAPAAPLRQAAVHRAATTTKAPAVPRRGRWSASRPALGAGLALAIATTLIAASRADFSQPLPLSAPKPKPKPKAETPRPADPLREMQASQQEEAARDLQPVQDAVTAEVKSGQAERLTSRGPGTGAARTLGWSDSDLETARQEARRTLSELAALAAAHPNAEVVPGRIRSGGKARPAGRSGILGAAGLIGRFTLSVKADGRSTTFELIFLRMGSAWQLINAHRL